MGLGDGGGQGESARNNAQNGYLSVDSTPKSSR